LAIDVVYTIFKVGAVEIGCCSSGNIGTFKSRTIESDSLVVALVFLSKNKITQIDKSLIDSG
jgi:hypothetical protein